MVHDGEHFRAVATHNLPPEFAELYRQPFRTSPGSPSQQLLNGERLVHIPDFLARAREHWSLWRTRSTSPTRPPSPPHWCWRPSTARTSHEPDSADTPTARVALTKLIGPDQVLYRAIDLVRYASGVGYLSNVATVLAELGERLSPQKLVEAAAREIERSNVQRLGYLLDLVGLEVIAGPLAERTRPVWT